MKLSRSCCFLTFIPCLLPAGMDLGAYQVILDKQLLGSSQQVMTPAITPPPTVAPPSWSRDYRLTMMTRDHITGNIRVGLQNVRDQTSLLLIEGRDRHQDYKLVSTNYSQGSAQISFRGATHRFDLQEGSALQGTAPVRGNAPSISGTVGASSRSVNRVRGSSRMSRSPAEQPTLQIRRFASQEELQEHLKQQQMDAIRTGKPPLPIPLTPAMDEQLVQEGVLPPQGGP